VNWLEYEVLIHALTAQLASWCGPVRLPHKAFTTKQHLWTKTLKRVCGMWDWPPNSAYCLCTSVLCKPMRVIVCKGKVDMREFGAGGGWQCFSSNWQV